MDFINKLGTVDINDYSAARVLAAGQEQEARNNNIFGAPAAGSGSWDFYFFRVSIDTPNSDGMALTLEDADGLQVTVDLDPDGVVSSILSAPLASGIDDVFHKLPDMVKAIKGAFSPYIKNAPVFTQPLVDTGGSDLHIIFAIPSIWSIADSTIVVSGDSTYTPNKIGAALTELTVEDVELTFTNNDDLRVTIDGNAYDDIGFNYLTAGSEASFISAGGGVLEALDAAIIAAGDNKLAYLFPISVDKANDTMTFRIAYSSAATVALSVIAVAD